jgi:hypothetical protein
VIHIVVVISKLNQNKNADIKCSATTRFWNNLHQLRSKSKDWKANILGAIKPKSATVTYA